MAHPKGRTGWYHEDHQTQREFERVGKLLLEDEKAITALAGALGTTPSQIIKDNSDPKDVALWALTIFIDNTPLNKIKVVQGINFNNNKAKSPHVDPPIAYLPIEWEGNNKRLDKKYRTIDDAERTDLTAWASIPLADLTAILGKMSVVVYRNYEDVKRYGMKGATYLNEIQLRNDELDPGPNKFYGTDPIHGNKGWQSYGNITGRLEVDFDYTDLTSSGSKVIGTIPPNKRIYKTSVIVEEAFDNDVTMAIGDDGGNGRLATTADVDLSIETIYDIELEVKYITETVLKLYQQSNVPTEGSGTVIIYYS